VLTTRFTRLIGCNVPIQQAGMGGVATAELASAVALAGALGMIGGVRLGAKVLGEELDSLPGQTRSRIGVNFLVPFLDRESLEVAASRVRVVEFFYGEPDADLIERAHGAGTLAAWQVGSVEEARAAAGAGCDFLVAQGIEAGGHVRGRIGLLPLLDGVLDAVNGPVLAAEASQQLAPWLRHWRLEPMACGSAPVLSPRPNRPPIPPIRKPFCGRSRKTRSWGKPTPPTGPTPRIACSAGASRPPRR
jgi:hypothetical protein